MNWFKNKFGEVSFLYMCLTVPHDRVSLRWNIWLFLRLSSRCVRYNRRSELPPSLILSVISLLIYSMVQSPSWEANWFAASQEIPRILWNLKVHYRTHTRLRHPSLSWASPVQSIYPHPTSWRSILILSTHLRLGLPSGSVISLIWENVSTSEGHLQASSIKYIKELFTILYTPCIQLYTIPFKYCVLLAWR